MKIAIIGTGISGLAAAFRLYRHHDIELFEANSYIGGHTNTVRVELDDEVQNVDTGFIVFNPRNYPGFQSILDEIGVESQPTKMSFSVTDSDGKFEYNGTNLNRLFAQRSNLLRPGFYGMIRDIMRFGRDVKQLLESPATQNESVEEFVARNGYRDLFVQRYLVPLGAALWSCPTQTFKQFPIRFVGEFLANHFMLQIGGRPQWRVIKGGSSRYVEKLVQPFHDKINLNCPIQSVSRTNEKVRIRTNSESIEFDHVIFACHADQALRLLADPTALESELLSLFPYQKNEIYLHTDSSVLPKRKLAWAAWNAKILTRPKGNPESDPQEDRAAVSYNMNILQSLESRHTFCVTLNESSEIAPESMLGQFTYHHPLFTISRSEAIRRHQELLNVNRSSFCGAYWGYGFHEDGVQSAFRVADTIERSQRQHESSPAVATGVSA